MRVLVTGAGVAGLTAAHAFAERGCTVRIVEQGEALGAASCSRFAGGMLAPWCERESAEERVAELGQEALAYWPKVHPATLRHGSLVVAPRRDERELDRFDRRTARHRLLDADGLAELEPDLAGRFGRALFFPDEAHLDPRAALPSLAGRLEAMGVPIRFGTEVTEPPSDIDLTVDCRGLAAGDLLPDLRGVKGEMLILRCPDVQLSRPVRMLHPRFPLYIVPRRNGLFMVGATMIESAERARVTARSVVELLNAAYTLHPAFGEAELVEIGADARPAFPNNLPRVRREGGRLFLNGLYRHGFLLSPALARIAAEFVLEGKQVEGITETSGGRT
ncbi:glycine oxidase ThiO [Geminicoccus flavidas]|uniref:glycine oxidase ThiO n=1 Tax=Geminicoccus flavidas TaxID=2506407 RepID=UPI00135A0ADB